MESIRKLTANKYVQYLFVFLVFLGLMLINLNGGIGFSDENDNFSGGLVVARGGMIYQDFPSQHMPFMYYLCALFSVLGASNSITFRLYFYVFFAIVFTLLYVRYGSKFGKGVILLTGFLYIVNMFTYFTCTAVSDQVQAFGMLVLMLEFLLFAKTKAVDIKNCIWISAAIVLSFGSAFVAIFAIFMIGVGVLSIEIKEQYHAKNKMGIWIKNLFFKYWKLVIIVALPFLVLILYYIWKRNLYEFYFGAYKMNRTIYPRYLSGYGGNISTTFLQPVDYLFSFFKSVVDGLASSTIESIRSLLCIAANVIFIVRISRKNKLVATILVLFTLMCGVRSINLDFHALPYVAVSVFMLASLIYELFIGVGKESAKGKITKVAAVLSVVIFATPFMTNFSSITKVADTLNQDPVKNENSYAYYVNQLTNEDDRILMISIDASILVDAQRMTLPSGVSTPWGYEAYGATDMENIVKYNPKVVIYNPDYAIWDYQVKDYAPEICNYIEENYTRLLVPSLTDLYVRNDLYDEAANRFLLDTDTTVSMGEGKGVISLESPITQVFTAEQESISRIRLKVGTYERTNRSLVNVIITQESTGDVIYTNDIDISEFQDNKYNILEEGLISVIPGENYQLTLTPVGNTADDYIAVYRTSGGESDNILEPETEQKVEPQNSIQGHVSNEKYNLCLKFDYPKIME